MEKNICGIFVTEYDSKDKAQAAIEYMKNCPHLIMAGVMGERTSMVFIVPDSLRWWFEGPAENPEVLGAKAVKVFIFDKIVYPEEYEPRLPDVLGETPPCGANCQECPMSEKYNCPGCPATLKYKG
ncbi:MAG: hypothetical protein ACFFAL_07825 [Promethearchaeota archaeon]